MKVFDVVIDSTCRSDSSLGYGISSSLFTAIISPPIVSVQKMYVKDVAIPFSYYGVTASNNSITFQESLGVAVTASVAAGNYSATSFISALGTAMTAVSPNAQTYTVTYSSNTNKITISSTGTFQVISATMSAVIGINPSTLPTALATTYTPTLGINLSGPTRIFIHCNRTNDTYVQGSRSGVILPLIVNAGPYEVITAGPNHDWGHTLGGDSISSISLSLRDQAGNLIDMNGGEWSITLEIVSDTDQ